MKTSAVCRCPLSNVARSCHFGFFLPCRALEHSCLGARLMPGAPFPWWKLTVSQVRIPSGFEIIKMGLGETLYHDEAATAVVPTACLRVPEHGWGRASIRLTICLSGSVVYRCKVEGRVHRKKWGIVSAVFFVVFSAVTNKGIGDHQIEKNCSAL